MADFTRLNGYNVKDTVAREGVNNLNLSKASHADVENAIADVNKNITDLSKEVDDLETLFNASGISQDAENITFNNTLTGLSSTHVQGAIEEVKEIAESAKTIAEGTQTAINELNGKISVYNEETDCFDIYVDGVCVGSLPCKFQKKYLYNEGDEATEITNGWSNEGYIWNTGTRQINTTPASKTENSMDFTFVSDSNMMCIGTNKSIDLSGYSRLVVKANCSQVGSSGGLTIILSSSNTDYNQNTILYDQNTIDGIGEIEYEFDISEINVPCYISISSHMSSAWGAQGSVISMYLD